MLAWPAPDGFSDGGDLPEGYIPVFFTLIEEQGRGP